MVQYVTNAESFTSMILKIIIFRVKSIETKTQTVLVTMDFKIDEVARMRR